jgi:catechol 2,3-dioxygenase-like lactoylglutathione lyase family enzyme
MPSRRLRLIHSPTPNWEAVRRFYRDVLLLPETRGWDAPGDRGVFLGSAAGEIELMEVDAAAAGIFPQSGGWSLALQVENAAAEYARLSALNVDLPRAPVSRPWGAVDFIVQDPAGNWILLFQQDAAP